MTGTGGTDWEQPPFEGDLQRIAVDLITGVVREVFEQLDALALVRSLGTGRLSGQEQEAVADLIDRAVVELEISFRESQSRS